MNGAIRAKVVFEVGSPMFERGFQLTCSGAGWRLREFELGVVKRVWFRAGPLTTIGAISWARSISRQPASKREESAE